MPNCKSCGAAIVWLKTKKGKSIPVDAHTYDDVDGMVYSSEKHVSHFATCPNADQHRNKHKNCCRITHIDTGITAIGTASKSRVQNQETAFKHLAARILAHHNSPKSRRVSAEEVRKYHEPRNEVVDHASGLRRPYKQVVIDGNLGEMINARRESVA